MPVIRALAQTCQRRDAGAMFDDHETVLPCAPSSTGHQTPVGWPAPVTARAASDPLGEPVEAGGPAAGVFPPPGLVGDPVVADHHVGTAVAGRERHRDELAVRGPSGYLPGVR